MKYADYERGVLDALRYLTESVHAIKNMVMGGEQEDTQLCQVEQIIDRLSVQIEARNDCREMAGKLAEALRFLLEPEFDYPVARRQALEVLRQYADTINVALAEGVTPAAAEAQIKRLLTAHSGAGPHTTDRERAEQLEQAIHEALAVLEVGAVATARDILLFALEDDGQ